MCQPDCAAWEIAIGLRGSCNLPSTHPLISYRRMNAPTFDAHSSACPICHQPLPLQPDQSLTGLLVCKRCQQRLVISWSGHYVRDPFRRRYADIERSLRRESHPFNRILRDLHLNRPSFLLIVLSSLLLLGVWGGVLRPLPPADLPVNQVERDRG